MTDLSPLLVLIRETAVLIVIYAIYVLGLNLVAGQLGLPQFGKVMFLALGGFVVGGIMVKLVLLIHSSYIIQKFGVDPLKNIGEYCSVYQIFIKSEIERIFLINPAESILFFLFSLILAAVVAGVFGILMAGPALRLREDYLGILLLVSAEALRVVTTYTPELACGVFGTYIPDPFIWLGDGRPWGFFIISVLIFVFIFILMERLVNSPFGRSLRAIRDAETAARVFGKDIVKYRTRALAIASAVGGVAGALFAFYRGFVIMSEYVPLYTFIAWTMLVIGGIGNNVGALVGAAVYITADRLISLNKEAIQRVVEVDPIYVQYMIFGLLIILILLYRPQGIVAEKPTKTLSKEELERLRK
ncbi:MAG: branched-chain amino acid ABC transporter permease [Pyrobaculum sp.]